MNHSARRINAVAKAIGAQRYLEIGVSQGDTFRNVAIAERTAVDPAFQFDPRDLANAVTRFAAQTSDAFFATEPHLPAYDVIFIDGLHVFEQVMRDFTNAIGRTHHRSVLLIDDTLPSDVLSAMPDEAATRRHRQAIGSPDVAWHGDVFKLICFVHDFWPSLNYSTIVGSENAQTLMWRSSHVTRRPLFGNLERISRLSYFDLQDHLGAMQSASEADALALCLSEIGAT